MVGICRNNILFQCEQESVVGEPVPGLGRENGLVRRIGHATNYRFASRNPSARAVFERASAKHAVALESGRLRGRPIRAKSRSKEWLGSPDRAHQDLLTRVEKPPCARPFSASPSQAAHDAPPAAGPLAASAALVIHAGLERPAAETLLRTHGRRGMYLLRQKQTGAPTTLSCSH